MPIGIGFVAVKGMVDAFQLYSALGKEPYHKDGKMSHYEVGAGWSADVDMKAANNKLYTSVKLCAPNGECREFNLALPLGRIQKRVLKHLANNTGWGWGDIKRSAKSITAKVGVKRMGKLVNSIITDPKFKAGMGLAGTIYPPLGVTYGTIQISANLLTDARAGNLDAQAKIMNISDMAKAGDVKAAMYARTMMVLNQAAKKGANVSGWAYNLPYRSNITAMSLDPKNPFHVARSMYHEGMMLGLK